jgi:hypothetical protein
MLLPLGEPVQVVDRTAPQAVRQREEDEKLIVQHWSANALAEVRASVTAVEASAAQRIKDRFINNSLAERPSGGDSMALASSAPALQIKTINYTPFLSLFTSRIAFRPSVKRCRSAH